MLQLRDFQQQASALITDRFRRYWADPPLQGTRSAQRRVPFFQALSSITASGKTVILADAVQAMSAELAPTPVVLWLSKGRVVVQQTCANLGHSGKYHDLIGTATVDWLASYDVETIRDAVQPLIYVATVGTFNQRDRETSDLLIYRSELDTQDTSTWDALKLRTDSEGIRRPLLIVYDEGHNLTDQQTDLLLELEPDALIAASATMKLPPRLGREVARLREAGWADSDFVTQVDASAVADSGLVKSRVLMAGYEAPMEEAVASLLDDLVDATAAATALNLDWQPKAIYVCKTNIVEGDAYRRDDPKQPFSSREAPPIVIWRYLVEECDVAPDEIAVYCALKINRDFPAPPDFHLYANNENDYDHFIAGNYRHIIFNKGLQEGWDDPSVYFAYVDKSMESDVAVEQLVGRLLRQPEGQHLPAERLNTAHMYVRLDRRNTFRDIVDGVTAKLGAEAPGIQLISIPPERPKPAVRPARVGRTVNTTDLDTRPAVDPVRRHIAHLTDYRHDDGTNTHAKGGRVLVQRNVGDQTDPDFEWEEFEHTNLVSVRWLFQREVRRRYPGALGVAETHALKFDALVGFGSIAYEQVLRTADDVVSAYTENILLVQSKPNPYRVGPVLVRPDDLKTFTNSLHEGYSDLNPEEVACARELDTTGLPWCRNPARSGYGIPLITIGRTRTFYPDFLVWTGGEGDSDVYAIDTTGAHLLADKTGRKMLTIRPPRGSTRELYVRFISRGHQDAQLTNLDDEGYTVWGRRIADASLRAHHTSDLHDAVVRALQPM
ncbi:MAG: hypothetical protein ACRDRO_08220 [Pseudonocardiaceae bacterium]